MQCCPLGNGYEYSFQSDYYESWKRIVKCIGEAGDYKQEIPLFLEYKLNEIRGNCFLESCVKTTSLLYETGNRNIGVTLDFGHSKYDGAPPAEALCLAENSPFPYYIYDNDGRWDWDDMCGTSNFQLYVEFIYYLKQFGYSDYLTSDTSPTRIDIKERFEANVRWTDKIGNILDALDEAELERLPRIIGFYGSLSYFKRYSLRL